MLGYKKIHYTDYITITCRAVYTYKTFMIEANQTRSEKHDLIYLVPVKLKKKTYNGNIRKRGNPDETFYCYKISYRVFTLDCSPIRQNIKLHH